MALVTQAAYARRCGVSRQAISKSVQNLGIPKHHKGMIDPEVADRMRGENSDPSQEFVQAGAGQEQTTPRPIEPNQADTGSGKAYRDARAEREHYTAQTAKLDYEKKLGQLLPRDMVAEAMGAAGVEIARAMDNLPLLADELTAVALSGGANAVRQLLRERVRTLRQTVADAISLPTDDGDNDGQDGRDDNVET